ncbi:MAG: hypothetical protein ACOYLC_13705, partial [Armatimonadaceae bacterium]
SLRIAGDDKRRLVHPVGVLFLVRAALQRRQQGRPSNDKVLTVQRCIEQVCRFLYPDTDKYIQSAFCFIDTCLMCA